jgi:hypothetical protein
MPPVAPVNLADLFALASAGSVTLGTLWLLVRLTRPSCRRPSTLCRGGGCSGPSRNSLPRRRRLESN